MVLEWRGMVTAVSSRGHLPPHSMKPACCNIYLHPVMSNSTLSAEEGRGNHKASANYRHYHPLATPTLTWRKWRW